MQIDSLSYNGGRGVGRHDGMVVFVPQTAPGDFVRVKITEQKPRYWEGELVEVLKASPHRRPAPCPVADRCGGCSWQHVTYAAQVEQKQKILNDSLKGLRKQTEWEQKEFLPAPSEFHYRNRIQVQIQNGKKGFFGKRSHDLVEVEDCLIAEPELNQKLKSLNTQEPRVELRVDHGSDFAQVNDAQNEVLKELVVKTVSFKPGWILDLYAGSGNLTQPLSAAFPAAHVMAIELSKSAVRKGTERLPKVRWFAGDVLRCLPKTMPGAQGVVVLDPPRIGCARGVMDKLLRLRPKQIVYVSCNPTTFARDVQTLLKSYRLESVQGLDMFPQTEHVELVASLCSAT